MIALGFCLLVSATDGWQKVGQRDGLSIEVRPVPGSKLEAVRVRGESRAPPEVQAEAIWGVPTREGVANQAVLGVHEILEDSEKRRVFYETVRAPLISTRDYVTLVERKADGPVHEITFVTVDDARRPTSPDKVRMHFKGSCIVEPAENGGGSLLTYQIVMDVGGSVPLWVVRRAQRDSAVEWMQVMRSRGEKRTKS